jgi:hypothetical protein
MSSEVVECYSGQTYAERPLFIHWEGQRLEVVEIQGRWRLPEGCGFRVRVADNRVFELFYDKRMDEWHIDPL